MSHFPVAILARSKLKLQLKEQLAHVKNHLAWAHVLIDHRTSSSTWISITTTTSVSASTTLRALKPVDLTIITLCDESEMVTNDLICASNDDCSYGSVDT